MSNNKPDDAVPLLSIEVFFDFGCPWCLIGTRHLRTAMSRLAELRKDVQVNVSWRGHQLLPGTPKEGVPYHAFYLARLGSAEAVAARRTQVQQAGDAAGIAFAFERIDVLPNTATALRLVAATAERGTTGQAAALVDRLFTAYFIEGENIGEVRVLERIALACGVQFETIFEQLSDTGSSHDSRERPRHTDYAISGVPFFAFNGSHGLSGAQRPEVMLTAMLEAIRG
jgi:predicted DsbA family dithiol-disulfide isomerase